MVFGIIPALAAFAPCAGGAAADIPGVSSGIGVRHAVRDTIEIVARRGLYFPLDRIGGIAPPDLRPTEQSILSRRPYVAYSDFRVRRPVPVSLVLKPRVIELSRFSCALYGADLGAGAASTLGGIGLVSGLCKERTAGYLMGAGALLGAIWGGTAGAEDSRFRIRVGVEDNDPAARRDRSTGRERE